MTTSRFELAHRIRFSDCDPAGIVFNPRFFEFFDRNTWMLFDAALGVTARAALHRELPSMDRLC